MFLKMCKSCQYCLETIYWQCCEEKYCFDEKAAAATLDDSDRYNHAYINRAASVDSVVTEQPTNNNYITSDDNRWNLGRDLAEIPVNADKIYEVFSNSMIFKDFRSNELATRENVLEELETTSEPDLLRPNRSKVYFEDEINSPITDLEIMFKDELLGADRSLNIENIPEEQEEQFEGLTMNVHVRKPGHDVVKPTTISLKEDDKITSQHPIYKYDPYRTVSFSNISPPKVEKVKSILRVKDAEDEGKKKIQQEKKMEKTKLTRVESLKSLESKNINKVLSRVPLRSASFLNLPQIKPVKTLKKSDSEFAIRGDDSQLSLVSHLPDTPLIKSANLPKFFIETPTLTGYKEEISLQSIQMKNDMKRSENDYSMPRYYAATPEGTMHESKSMPDLRVSSSSKGNKRLLKLRSKLKPLVIKKGTDDQV